VLSFNPEASLADNLKEMTSSFQTVDAGQVTYAVRDTQIGKLTIKKDDIIGLDKGQLVTTGSDIEAVTTNLIDRMLTEDKEVVTLYYGADVKEEDAEAYVEKLAETHPDIEFYSSLRRTTAVLLRAERGVILTTKDYKAYFRVRLFCKLISFT